MVYEGKIPISRTVLTAPGNVSADIRERLARWFDYASELQSYGKNIAMKLEVTEIAVFDSVEEPRKKQARLVMEIETDADMCNNLGILQGGCIAFLVDLCSSLTLDVLIQHISPGREGHVSLGLELAYHAPTKVGCRIRIVNTTLSLGARVMSTRTKIYDMSEQQPRLLASGTHLKMAPSKPFNVSSSLGTTKLPHEAKL